MKEWVERAGLLIVGFAIIAVFLGLTVILSLTDSDHELTASMVDTLQTVALPAAIAAILTKMAVS